MLAEQIVTIALLVAASSDQHSNLASSSQSVRPAEESTSGKSGDPSTGSAPSIVAALQAEPTGGPKPESSQISPRAAGKHRTQVSTFYDRFSALAAGWIRQLSSLAWDFYAPVMLLLVGVAGLVLGRGRNPGEAADQGKASLAREPSTGPPQVIWTPAPFTPNRMSRQPAVWGSLITLVGLGVTAAGAADVLHAYLRQQGPPMRWGLLIIACGQLVLLIGIALLAVQNVRQQKLPWREGSATTGQGEFPVRHPPANGPGVPGGPHWLRAVAPGGLVDGAQIAQMQFQLDCLSRELEQIKAQGYNQAFAGKRRGDESSSPE